MAIRSWGNGVEVVHLIAVGESISEWLLSPLASDEPLAVRAAQARTPVPPDLAAQVEGALLAGLSGEPQQAELALVSAHARTPPPLEFLIDLGWALLKVETGSGARALVHVARARLLGGNRLHPADEALLRLIEAQAMLNGDRSPAPGRLARDALAVLSMARGSPLRGYALLVAARLAFEAGDAAAAAERLSQLRERAPTGLLGARAEQLAAEVQFALTNDAAGALAPLDRAIATLVRLGATRDLGLAYLARATLAHAAGDDPADWLTRAQPLLVRGGGPRDLQLLRRSAHHLGRPLADRDGRTARALERLHERRVQLQQAVSSRCEAKGGPCPELHRCEGYQAIDEVLEVVDEAEEHLVGALEHAMADRTRIGRLAAATHEIAVLSAIDSMLPAIPRLALEVCPGTAAAILQVAHEGRVVCSSGAAFETPAEELRDAAWAAASVAPAAADLESMAALSPEEGMRPAGRFAALPLGPAGTTEVLMVERSDQHLTDRDVEHLRVYASLAGAALARARATAALQESASRDAATLRAIRDGIVALDREGRIHGVNEAAASILGAARNELIGRRLRDRPGLAPLAAAIALLHDADVEVVTLPRGEVVVRCEPYEGGVVATLRDMGTEQNIAERLVHPGARFTFEHLAGQDRTFLALLEEARRAAHTDLPVLICGESGTGKELLAQAIHNASPRASARFLGINVTAIPRELLESELFGYEGGAFTGARSAGRAGKFELAGRGTLLLDEIGDMPLEMQGKLLRVLQERVVQRLGGSREIPVRARIIATTHANLEEAVKLGTFRLDLFHRLRVVHLHIPPLRERKGDVEHLLAHLLLRHAARTGEPPLQVDPGVLAALEAYDWPGNVRELVNVMEGEISLLPAGERVLSRVPRALDAGVHPARDRRVVPLADLERTACEDALALYGGNVAKAARALGIAKGTLYSRLRRYGLKVPDGQDPAKPVG